MYTHLGVEEPATWQSGGMGLGNGGHGQNILDSDVSSAKALKQNFKCLRTVKKLV